MKITTFTVIICIFASFSLVRLLRRVVRDGTALPSALVWIVTWTSLAVFSIFPDLLNGLVAAAGMENRVFFVLMLAVLVLSGLLFNLTSRVDRLHRDIGLTVRELAVANYRIDNLDRKKQGDGPMSESQVRTAASGPRNPAQESLGDDVAPVREDPLDHPAK
jgi:hypothetical protein